MTRFKIEWDDEEKEQNQMLNLSQAKTNQAINDTIAAVEELSMDNENLPPMYSEF